MRMPPWKDIIEAVWMILPRRWRATHSRAMRWLSRKIEVRFVSMTSSQSVSGKSTNAPRRMVPPLLTRMSGQGNAPPNAAINLSSEARLAWSAEKQNALRPAVSTSVFVALRSPRATRMMAAPASARACAIAAPSPREAPVTRATFPSRRKVSRTVAMGKSPQAGDRGGIHVGEFLVFAAHAPDEAVGGGAGAAVDGPRRGGNRPAGARGEGGRGPQRGPGKAQRPRTRRP